MWRRALWTWQRTRRGFAFFDTSNRNEHFRGNAVILQMLYLNFARSSSPHHCNDNLVVLARERDLSDSVRIALRFFALSMTICSVWTFCLNVERTLKAVPAFILLSWLLTRVAEFLRTFTDYKGFISKSYSRFITVNDIIF